eukprot:scaffold3.g6590.t1
MRVVALVSGGKDSCYNMVLCQQYGHEVVALANLLPAQQETDDLDSYMYQTVGHQVIAAYAQCMGLPLYRRRITGQSREQRLVYEDTAGDEVEDLHALLAYVQARHPGVQAVASGAIASDYQRTRVERVCARLGLVSLAYLWHRPQAALLRAMVAAPIRAILVKIAAAGLTPECHLGAELARLPAQLAALRRRYGINVCGEGGEYETLTLDCPLFVRARITLDAWRPVLVSADSLAPVALLHPTAFHVETKHPAAAGGALAAADGGAAVPGGAASAPGQAAQPAAGEVVEVKDDYWGPEPAATTSGTGGAAGAGALALRARLHVADCGGQFVTLVAEVPASGPANAAGCGGAPAPATAEGTAAALGAALARVDTALPGLDLAWGRSLFCHLYVPSMAQFGAANAAYARYFPAVNPPSRATVELGASSELALVVEVLFARAPVPRRVLHVQSISCWAPSCIGPYSQALHAAGLVLCAGQIGLHPPTMDVVAGGLDVQCVRCLASCQAVAVAMRTDLPQSLLWCTAYCADAAGAAGWAAAAAHLEALLEGRLATELLQGAGPGQQRGLAGGAVDGEGGSGGASAGEGEKQEDEQQQQENEEEEEEEDELDDYLRPPAMHRHWRPLVTFVTVPQLPRGVLVEIQPVACVVDATAEEGSSSNDSDGERDGRHQRRQHPTRRAGTMPGWIGRLEVAQRGGASSLASPGRLCRARAAVDEGADGELPQRIEQAAVELCETLTAAQLGPADLVSVKAYCKAELLGSALSAEDVRRRLAGPLGAAAAAAAVVPVGAVGADADSPACVLVEALALRHP